MQYSKRSFIWFIVIAFFPVWCACALLALSDASGATVTVTFAACMFAPTMANLLTRLICKEGFADMRLRPHFKGNWGRYALAYFLPAVLTVLGCVVFFLTRPDLFDKSSSLLLAQGVAPSQLSTVIALELLLGVLGAPLINFIPALGEELGWRGYLAPKLATVLSERAAVVITGAIWGLWHAPMIALGHNYGTDYAGYPLLGILMMTLFCICFGAMVGLLSLRTKSALPAALAHAGLNGIASVGLLFCLAGYDPLLGPLTVSLVSGIPTIVCGVICFLLLGKNRPSPASEDAAA